MRKKQLEGVFLAGVVVLAVGAGPSVRAAAPESVPVCVFRFRMTSDTPRWQWLEQAIADRLITSLHQTGHQVLQRDAMQDLAKKLHWTPEMMTAPGKLDMLKQALAPDVLVSGTYGIDGDGVSVTAVIVNFKTRKVVARRTLAGKTDTATELVQKLSAEVLAWFTKRPVDAMRAEVPAWTESIPAAKALYEGVSLYDQGRYAQAWTQFKKASREDPKYAETRYWLGKMFYFMGRYAHARDELERFLIAHRKHPRTGGAVKEYVNTHEWLAASPTDLMAAYAELGKSMFRDYTVPGESADRLAHGRLTVRQWVQYKKALLLSEIGRHVEAVQAVRGLQGMTVDNFVARESRHARKKQGMIADYHKVRLPAEWYRPYVWFDAKTGKPKQRVASGQVILAAPPGHDFKRLVMKPLFLHKRLDKVKMKITISESASIQWIHGAAPGLVRKIDAAVAAKDGVVLDRLPVGGQILMETECAVKILELGVTAELVKLEDPGAIDVLCAETSDFYMEVDDSFGTLGPGPVGPLAPGKHTLRFYPLGTTGVQRCWSTNVTVTARETRRVIGHLPMKEHGAWPAQVRTAVVGKDYPRPVLALRGHPLASPATAVQADNEAIRVVWDDAGSLWYVESRDGQNFSPPKPLPPPVSSAWNESHPRLFRDHSGRYVLTFLSNRTGGTRSYWCWSRDLKRWSNPIAMGPDLPEGWIGMYDAMVDDKGQFIVAETHVTKERGMPDDMARRFGTVRIVTSSDGRQWRTVYPGKGKDEPIKGLNRCWRVVNLFGRKDGGYGAIFVDPRNSRNCTLVSSDGKEWSGSGAAWPNARVTDRGGVAVVRRRHGRTVVQYDDMGNASFMRLFTTEIEPWHNRVEGAYTLVTVQAHPRWGILCSWIKGRGWEGVLGRRHGPFFIRVPRL